MKKIYFIFILFSTAAILNRYTQLANQQNIVIIYKSSFCLFMLTLLRIFLLKYLSFLRVFIFFYVVLVSFAINELRVLFYSLSLKSLTL